MKVVVLNGQSLLDISIQELGDISGLFDIAEKAGLSLTQELEAGQEFELPLRLSNKEIAEYYASNKIKPATAFSIQDILVNEGVEYWGIEYDFIVS